MGAERTWNDLGLVICGAVPQHVQLKSQWEQHIFMTLKTEPMMYKDYSSSTYTEMYVC